MGSKAIMFTVGNQRGTLPENQAWSLKFQLLVPFYGFIRPFLTILSSYSDGYSDAIVYRKCSEWMIAGRSCSRHIAAAAEGCL
jgi:hypothetical protein